jgi:hypothetical protein
MTRLGVSTFGKEMWMATWGLPGIVHGNGRKPALPAVDRHVTGLSENLDRRWQYSGQVVDRQA